MQAIGYFLLLLKFADRGHDFGKLRLARQGKHLALRLEAGGASLLSTQLLQRLARGRGHLGVGGLLQLAEDLVGVSRTAEDDVSHTETEVTGVVLGALL